MNRTNHHYSTFSPPRRTFVDLDLDQQAHHNDNSKEEESCGGLGLGLGSSATSSWAGSVKAMQHSKGWQSAPGTGNGSFGLDEIPTLSLSPPPRRADVDDVSSATNATRANADNRLNAYTSHGMGNVVRVPGGEDAYELDREIGQGAFSRVWKAHAVQQHFTGEADPSGVVAVKILSRRSTSRSGQQTGLGRQSSYLTAMAKAERASFQREVDVLKHLRASADSTHESLPVLHAAFSLVDESDSASSTTTTTSWVSDVLVLEYIPGGELLDLVNSDEAHAKLGERLLRRMWSELVDVVAWIHDHNVVHRDIKLEST
jgi:hypothetical protein